MSDVISKAIGHLPRAIADRFAVAVMALLGLASLASLVSFWGIQPEYADRILIVAGSLYVSWYHWPEVLAAEVRPRLFLGTLLVLLALLIVPVGWLLFARSTVARTAVLWFQWFGWLALVVGFILARYGWPRLRILAFPIIFILFALPLPSTLIAPLQQKLQEGMTSIAGKVLPIIGIPILKRDGVILVLKGGSLGIEEACSGVRSLTALTALAAFIAYLRGFGPARGVLLVVLSIPVVLAVNATRVVLSGVIQEIIGQKYIVGDYHEGLGFAMVFLGLGFIILTARLIGPAAVAPSEVVVPQPVEVPKTSLPTKALLHGTIALTLVLTVAGFTLGWNAESQLSVQAPLDQLPLKIGNWEGTDIEIPKTTTLILAQDRAIHRIYTNNLGQELHVWVIFWASADLVKGYHHPDVCMGNVGYTVAEKRRENLSPKDGGSIDATVRELVKLESGEEKDRQFIVYWTQEGNRVWNDEDEHRAESGGFFMNPKHWIGEFTRKPEQTANGRIVILIGTRSLQSAAQKETLTFARELAGQVYELCPWAGPPVSK